MTSRIRKLLGKVSSVFQMAKIAWEAQPLVFIIQIIFSISRGALPIVLVWISKLIFDMLGEALVGGLDDDFVWDLIPLLLIQVALRIVSNMLFPLDNFLNSELSRKLTIKIQTAIYTKINNLAGIAHFENSQFYSTVQLATQGAQAGPKALMRNLTLLLQGLTTLLGFIGVLVIFSPLLAVLVALAAIPELYAQIKMGRQRYSLSYKVSPAQRRAGYYGGILSGIHSAKEIRLFDLANYLMKKWVHASQNLQKIDRVQEFREMRWKLFLSVFSSLFSGGTFIFVIAQGFTGNLSLGDVTLYTGAVGGVRGALSSIVMALSLMNESILFFSQYNQLLSLPQPIQIPDQPRQLQPLKLGIEIRNLSFRYTEQHPWVLRNVNLTIPHGQCLALVGKNGAGKTTLVKLLTRLYDPTEGEILWDNTDIREFSPVDLRRRMGAIFQDFVRFDLTAQENIGFGDVEHIDDLPRIQEAAKDAGVHELIQALPEGYQSILSRWLVEDDVGTDLSYGEWQKIAIARMLMRKAELLILDEPTAALDAQAEFDIYNHFSKMVTGRTSLLISHRFSTVQMAEKIAVLENGGIIEHGTHEELMSLNGIYAKLYTMQTDRYQ